MRPEKQKLLAALKAELAFLEKGGYRKLSWRPQFIFEDSPTCLNYRDPERTKQCTECVLMQLVPEDSREKSVPCRHIPLNDRSETVASLYHWASQEEMEAAVRGWLRKEIQELEEENTGIITNTEEVQTT